MNYIEYGTAAYRWAFFSMLLGNTVAFAILYSPQTLIQTFSQQFAISPSTASLTISFATSALAVGMLVITVVSNAWGRKKIMGIALVMTSLLFILSAFSPNFETLIVLRILQGVALSGFPAIAITYLNEEISPLHIGKIIGIYFSGCAFGGFFGRVVISTLTDAFSWNLAVLVLGVISLICSILFWIYLPESKHFTPIKFSFQNWIAGISGGLSNKNLYYIYGLGFLLLGTNVVFFNYIGFPLSQSPYYLSQTAIGFLFIFQMAGSWGSYVAGRLLDKFSRTFVISASILTIFIGAVMSLSGHIIILIVGLVLFAAGFLAGQSLASGWIGFIAGPQTRVYASSLYFFFYYMGSGLIGWSGGLFLNKFGWYGVIIMIVAILLIIGVFVFALNRSLQTSQQSGGVRAKQLGMHKS